MIFVIFLSFLLVSVTATDFDSEYLSKYDEEEA